MPQNTLTTVPPATARGSSRVENPTRPVRWSRTAIDRPGTLCSPPPAATAYLPVVGRPGELDIDISRNWSDLVLTRRINVHWLDTSHFSVQGSVRTALYYVTARRSGLGTGPASTRRPGTSVRDVSERAVKTTCTRSLLTCPYTLDTTLLFAEPSHLCI